MLNMSPGTGVYHRVDRQTKGSPSFRKHPIGKRKLNCFCVVHSYEKEDFLENSCILSCSVQFKSILFNLLCVFDHTCGRVYCAEHVSRDRGVPQSGTDKRKEEIAGVRVYYAEHVSRDRGVPQSGTDKQKEEIAGVGVYYAEHSRDRGVP